MGTNPLFRIKICGVTCSDDAQMVADAGADALGLNFYPKSKRFVEIETACGVVKQLPKHVQRVGVFVNASIKTILKTVNEVGLDCVQLHGDEPPEFLGELTDTKVIRAFRYKDRLEPVVAWLDQCERPPVGVLLDAWHPSEYGGTGNSLSWPELSNVGEQLDPPFILAGGLNPENVGRAIREAVPNAVDTASGVELASPRRKDPDLTRRFVSEALAAFA